MPCSGSSERGSSPAPASCSTAPPCGPSARARHGLPTACYGHAGDGNLHVNLLFGSQEERAKSHAAVEEVLQAAIDLGGTITGEHGVGLAKRAFLAREQGPEVIALERRLKH